MRLVLEAAGVTRVSHVAHTPLAFFLIWQVGMVLEATADQLDSQLLSRAEHKRITAAILEGTHAENRKAVAAWRQKHEKRRAPVPVPGIPDAGPMWIPGMAPPSSGGRGDATVTLS